MDRSGGDIPMEVFVCGVQYVFDAGVEFKQRGALFLGGCMRFVQVFAVLLR